MLEFVADGFFPLLEIFHGQVLAGIGGLVRQREDSADFSALSVQARVNFGDGDGSGRDLPLRCQLLLQRATGGLEKTGRIASGGCGVHLCLATGNHTGGFAPSRASNVLRAPVMAAQETKTSGKTPHERALTAQEPRSKIERAQAGNFAAGLDMIRAQTIARRLAGRSRTGTRSGRSGRQSAGRG